MDLLSAILMISENCNFNHSSLISKIRLGLRLSTYKLRNYHLGPKRLYRPSPDSSFRRLQEVRAESPKPHLSSPSRWRPRLKRGVWVCSLPTLQMQLVYTNFTIFQPYYRGRPAANAPLLDVANVRSFDLMITSSRKGNSGSQWEFRRWRVVKLSCRGIDQRAWIHVTRNMQIKILHFGRHDLAKLLFKFAKTTPRMWYERIHARELQYRYWQKI